MENFGPSGIDTQNFHKNVKFNPKLDDFIILNL
jgi:hypothetical protein